MRDSHIVGVKRQLLQTLEILGPTGAEAVCRRLGISQPTFSRLVRSMTDAVLVVGRARATRYAARRLLPGVSVPIPVYEVRPEPESPRHLVNLHPVAPGGFFAEAVGPQQDAFFDDLPWYLQDLRPAGFLGRLLAKSYAELGYPEDVRLWSTDQVVSFLFRFGWDLPGAFVVGDEAWLQFAAFSEEPREVVTQQQRPSLYPKLARRIVEAGPVGSSAAGEQPKFLAVRRLASGDQPVLVKFSPPATSPLTERVADLLVAEHLGHLILRDWGFDSPRSQLLVAENRTFLETERFDRQGTRHRIGQVTLAALDSEFVGSDLNSWEASVANLVRQGVVPADDHDGVRRLSLFGQFIGNTDMHFGNLAFRLSGLNVSGLAPIYDMTPMHYHPRHQELPATLHPLPGLTPRDAPDVADVMRVALSFWAKVADDERISQGFRTIARANIERINRVMN